MSMLRVTLSCYGKHKVRYLDEEEMSCPLCPC